MVSQCYDGASVMSGCNAGVQTIQARSQQAVYVHCHAHRLNTVLVDVVKKMQLANDFFKLLELLYVFLSSSKSHEKFMEIQEVERLGFKNCQKPVGHVATIPLQPFWQHFCQS